MGGAECLGSRELKVRAHGNLFSAGAEAQANSYGEAVLG